MSSGSDELVKDYSFYRLCIESISDEFQELSKETKITPSNALKKSQYVTTVDVSDSDEECSDVEIPEISEESKISPSDAEKNKAVPVIDIGQSSPECMEDESCEVLHDSGEECSEVQKSDENITVTKTEQDKEDMLSTNIEDAETQSDSTNSISEIPVKKGAKRKTSGQCKTTTRKRKKAK